MLDVLFIAVISGFILYKLYNMLGQDDNSDINLKNRKIIDVTPKENLYNKNDISKNFIDVKESVSPILKPVIDKILFYDPTFSEETFISGAKRAFEMILQSFSKGDINTLKFLLSENTLTEFINSINSREVDGIYPETTLVSILRADITSVNIEKSYIKIKITFISEQINISRDKEGKILNGNPSHIDRIEDTWTFARDLKSNNPNWQLIATNI
ncbi:MAG: Tim44/TimA family putative adaptor protein [Rickettsiales endosymbiont of Dermacentor nuttalli]